MKKRIIEEEFNEEFSKCDCRNGLPPHFDDSKVNRDWVFNFFTSRIPGIVKELVEEEEREEYTTNGVKK